MKEEKFKRERRELVCHSHLEIPKKTAVKAKQFVFYASKRIRQEVVALKINKKDLERT